MWTSKLRCGLQLCTEVRLTEEHPKSLYMTMAQRSQNKILRILDGALVLVRKSTKTLLDNQNMLSVICSTNQTDRNVEMWKASNDPQSNYIKGNVPAEKQSTTFFWEEIFLR